MPEVYSASRLPLFVATPELDARLVASFNRLSQPDYSVATVIAETVIDSWPGDLAGRLLLSLSRFARAGFPALPHATALFEGMLESVNSDGYFGPLLSDAIDQVIDEQQVACHGWVVAGMLQYSAVSGDARASEAAFRIVDTLLLPALAHLDDYPFDRDTSAEIGGASGSADVIVSGWQLSTDIWCVFLALNGLVPCFQQSGRRDIGAAVVALRMKLDRLDVVAQRAQLHASLSAGRCLADFAEIALADPQSTPASPGVAAASVEEAQFSAAQSTAVRLYEAYATRGRTLNYATFNWFGRPDSWTEPCAIVDSLELARTLWRLTREERYLTDAHRIEYNALATAEREDGSFGLDSIMTPDRLELVAIHPDARWCCTMRGALGLLEAREGSVAIAPRRADNADVAGLEVTGFHSGTITFSVADQGDGGSWVLRETTAYPADGRVAFEVISAPAVAASLSLTVREHGAVHVLELPARAGAIANIDVTLDIVEELVDDRVVAVFRGPLLHVIRSQPAHTASQRRARDAPASGVGPQ